MWLTSLRLSLRVVYRVVVRVAIDLVVHWESHWQPPRSSVCMRNLNLKCIR